MNAHAFRHFYDYHFAENRKVWDFVTQLSYEQFTEPVGYSHGSVRDQVVHILSTDDAWFRDLRGVESSESLGPATVDDRERIRAYWDNVEHTMREYLATLQDVMLFEKPLPGGEDKDLILWQVLLHVANHGTDHRAQLLRLLGDLGVKTESQDYVFYAYRNVIRTPQGEWITKSALLRWLQDEYRQWETLLDQIGPERMDQSGVNGAWSMKDIVAHLTGWQRRVVANLQAAHRGEPKPPPPWPAHLEAEDDINAWIYDSHRERSVHAVLDEAHQVHQQLLAVVEGLPDDVRVEHIEPAFYLVWVNNERFLTGEFFNHFHDDHEPNIRAWLARDTA